LPGGFFISERLSRRPGVNKCAEIKNEARSAGAVLYLASPIGARRSAAEAIPGLPG